MLPRSGHADLFILSTGATPDPARAGVKGARRASLVTVPQAPPLTPELAGSRLERRQDDFVRA